MILSFGILALTFLVIFTVPTDYIAITNLYIYSILVLYRVYRNNMVLIDILLLSINAFISLSSYILKLDSILPYTGSIFYGFISVGSIIGAALSKPLTLFSAQNIPPEHMLYHRLLSASMGVLYLIPFYFSISLFPSPGYIYIPLIMIGIFTPLSIFLAKKFTIQLTSKGLS